MSQAPLRGCRCEPLVRKLENQLQATKEEMKTEVHAVQDLINRRVGQQELRSRQQVSDRQRRTSSWGLAPGGVKAAAALTSSPTGASAG